MNHHHSHNRYDKIRLNLGTRALVKIAELSVPFAIAVVYGYCVSKMLNSYASANEKKARAENSSSIDELGRTR